MKVEKIGKGGGRNNRKIWEGNRATAMERTVVLEKVLLFPVFVVSSLSVSVLIIRLPKLALVAPALLMGAQQGKCNEF